jgi:hypothetical protein
MRQSRARNLEARAASDRVPARTEVPGIPLGLRSSCLEPMRRTAGAANNVDSNLSLVTFPFVLSLAMLTKMHLNLRRPGSRVTQAGPMGKLASTNHLASPDLKASDRHLGAFGNTDRATGGRGAPRL